MTELGKITLPPEPKFSTDFETYKRNVAEWTRQVEKTFRAFERAFNELSRAVDALTP